MKYGLRVTNFLLHNIHRDLDRPHEVAWERVGWLFCRRATDFERVVLLGEHYMPVGDADYLESDEAGAVVGAAGIRAAMQHAYQQRFSVVHLHRHEHGGVPSFSKLDARENGRLIPTFWNVVPNVPHAALVLSWDKAAGVVWCPDTKRSTKLVSITQSGARITELLS